MLRKQISINLLANYFATGINMLLGLLIIPFLIRKLGKDAFGLILLAESIIVFLEIATIGVRLSLSRHATFSLAQGRNEEFIEFLSTSRYVLLVLASLILTAGLLVSFNFSNIFYVPDIYTTQSKILFFLITVSYVITTLNITFWSVLYVKQRMDLINIAVSSGMLLRALGIFVFLSILPKRYITLTTYGIIYLIMVCAREFIVYIWHRKVMPGIRISLKYFSFLKIKDMFSFGFFSTISHVSTIFSDQAANIIVNIFWGAGFNALYGIGLKFPMVMRRLFLEPTWVLTPTFTHLAAKNDKERLETLFFMYTKIISIITMPLCFILIFFAKPIILSWVGNEFVPSIRILQIHMVSLLAVLPFSIGGCITNAYAKVKIPSFIAVAEAICSIALCIILGRVFPLGLLGIALASAIPIFLVSALFSPYYSCKIAGLSVKEYWVKTFIMPFIWAAFTYGIWFFAMGTMGLYLSADRFMIPYLAIIAIILSAIYCLGAYRFLLSTSERGRLKQILPSVLDKLIINVKQVPDIRPMDY